MGRKRPWTDDQLKEAVAQEKSFAAVLRRLGYRPSGGMHSAITFHVNRLGLDTTHFTRQGWARGTRGVTSHPRPLVEVLVAASSYTNVGKLRIRLIREGLKSPQCESCGMSQWLGERIALELDHVNGDRRDHRLENLRILCPNCHAQTEMWCRSKNRLKPT